MTAMTNVHVQELFPLPRMAKYLEQVRDNLINGYGFLLFQGMPVKEWGMRKSATTYMGLGAHFGHIVSQNGRGHVLGHIKDLGENPADFHKVRLYRTTARYAYLVLGCGRRIDTDAYLHL